VPTLAGLSEIALNVFHTLEAGVVHAVSAGLFNALMLFLRPLDTFSFSGAAIVPFSELFVCVVVAHPSLVLLASVLGIFSVFLHPFL